MPVCEFPARGFPRRTESYLTNVAPIITGFETGITQSMAWTILATYLKSCPKNNPKIEWRNFPALAVVNQPDVFADFSPAITRDRTLTAPGREINLTWDAPGKKVGPDQAYVTSTGTSGKPKVGCHLSSDEPKDRSMYSPSRSYHCVISLLLSSLSSTLPTLRSTTLDLTRLVRSSSILLPASALHGD